MTTLVKNITPEINWDLDCGDDMCDGYCDIHSAYARKGCDSLYGCDSTISTYLAEVEGFMIQSLCHYHYHTLKEGN